MGENEQKKTNEKHVIILARYQYRQSLGGMKEKQEKLRKGKKKGK